MVYFDWKLLINRFPNIWKGSGKKLEGFKLKYIWISSQGLYTILLRKGLEIVVAYWNFMKDTFLLLMQKESGVQS